VGGYRGEVRGSSKIKTYLNYLKKCESWELTRIPDPKCKKYCKKQMMWDAEKREWVLRYHFSS
jgi:hypothetical protein